MKQPVAIHRSFKAMSNPLHNWLESKEVPTAERIIRRVASPESFLENQPSQSQRPSNRRTSTASDGSRYTSATDASSRKSSASTTASSAPSLYGPLPVAEYYLHCPFEFLGCGISYLPSKLPSFHDETLFSLVCCRGLGLQFDVLPDWQRDMTVAE